MIDIAGLISEFQVSAFFHESAQIAGCSVLQLDTEDENNALTGKGVKIALKQVPRMEIETSRLGHETIWCVLERNK